MFTSDCAYLTSTSPLIIITLVFQDVWSPLPIASYNEHLDIVRALIEAEANISQANKVSTVFVTVSFHNLCTGGEHVHAAQKLLL